MPQQYASITVNYMHLPYHTQSRVVKTSRSRHFKGIVGYPTPAALCPLTSSTLLCTDLQTLAVTLTPPTAVRCCCLGDLV